MRMKTLLAFVAALLVLSAPMAFGQNLLANGSFETGDFSGWTTTGNFEFSGVTNQPFYVYSGAQDGSFYSYWGPVGDLGGITQSFSDTAGAQYTFSFWLNAVGDDPSEVQVLWNGDVLLDQRDPNTGNLWQEFSYQVTGTGNDSVTFLFRDDPAYIALDNVSVEQSGGGGTVPEPSSFLLMGSGVLGLAGVIRRKMRG
jgi:PEP-CTERM motif-containing protein